jgi:DNA-binding response OmpR family regulator
VAILVVEDDEDLSQIIAYILQRAGHEVLRAYDGLTALRVWRAEAPSLVLLDLNLPGLDGWEVCRRIRSQSATPIVMLTAYRDDASAISGFNLGTDEYITKPFSPEQLVARIEAVLRRAYQPNSDARTRRIKVGDVELDIRMNGARVRGQDVHLTTIEFRLLRALTLRDGQVVRHPELVQSVWGHKRLGGESLLRSHVRNLRRKIEPDPTHPRYLQTIPHVGYRFTHQQPADVEG